MTFFERKKTVDVTWVILGVMAFIALILALFTIGREAHICMSVESALDQYFKHPSTQEYLFNFDQKYGKDYICVYDQENATLICKYPIYKRIDEK